MLVPPVEGRTENAPVPAAVSGMDAGSLPNDDERAAVPPRTLNTPRTFPAFHSLAEWKARKDFIRQQLLVSTGLYPLPPRTPLRAKVFGRMDREGYTIEKVYFQTYPGFYLAGNLYRPREGAGPRGPHPGILVAHGHWAQGRMANTADGSIPARAITFARQGCVAFTYDMVGYNDTRQINHQFAGDREHWLWGISLMGLQTWNSIRALDFLASLPDVDKNRLAITGESGGGTQTMMLGAVDDRLAAVGPCVMVSHTMQGGCLCENAPGLRIEFSNMELAAAAAPRPQIMVAATGDWTKTMMTVEGPAVESVYRLYDVPEHLKYVIFNYGHNINKDSREAVYAFFGKWLLHQNNPQEFKEPPYQMERVADLRVFGEKTPLPADAKDAAGLTRDLMALARSQLDGRKPRDRRSLTAFQKTFLPAWRHTLALDLPSAADLLTREEAPTPVDGGTLIRLHLGRRGKGDSIPAALFRPGRETGRGVVIVHPDGRSALMDETTGKPGSLVHSLLEKGRTVLLLDAFLTGDRSNPAAEAARKPFENYFSTYNRTDLQERVQDLVTCCSYLRSLPGIRDVSLLGEQKAGLWAILAAPAADSVAADCAQLDLSTDDALLTDDLFVPGLRRMGDFQTAATLAAPHPLLLHNTGSHFLSSSWLQDVYQAAGASPAIQVHTDPVSEEELVAWVTGR